MKPNLNKTPLLILIGLAFAITGFAFASPDMRGTEEDSPINKHSHKVSLCHKTSSEETPYVFLTVAHSGGIHGHMEHEDDLFNISSPDDCQENPDDTTSSTQETATPTATQVSTSPPEPSATPTPTSQYGTTNICHSTGDSENPYEFITITDDETYTLHANHTGDIFDVEEAEDCPTVLRKFMADRSGNTKPK